MTDEFTLLQAALADPTDDLLLVAYADWLEEQADDVSVAKADFLRLTARLRALPNETAQQVRTQLQELAAKLDPTWLVVVSRLAVENCGERRKAQPHKLPYFSFECDRQWETMQPTGDPNVRLCTSCGENVYYCDTIVTARDHARAGHCIAVDLGIIRRKDDVAPRRYARGRPSPDFWEREAERLRVDPVSAERERLKKSQQEPTEHGEEPTS